MTCSSKQKAIKYVPPEKTAKFKSVFSNIILKCSCARRRKFRKENIDNFYVGELKFSLGISDSNARTLNIHDTYSPTIGVRKQYTQYLREAQAIIYVIDLSDKNSIVGCITDIQNITDFYINEGRSCHLCIALNKRDLVQEDRFDIEKLFLGFQAERFICSFKFKWGESQMIRHLFELMA